MFLFITGVIPAAIAIADQPGGIHDQDETLGVIQDLAGKITFALQFRLKILQPRDIEHQAAVLDDSALRVQHGECVDEHVHSGTVFASKRLLVIAQHPMLLHELRQPLPHLGGRIDYGVDIHLQQLLPAAITQHADQRIVHFNKASFRRREEKALLNVVKQFSIATLRFAAIGDVFENVNGLKPLIVCPMNTRGRDQISALQHGMNKFIGAITSSTEWTRVRGSFGGQGQERPHIKSHQLNRLDPDKFRQRTIHTQHIVGLVMDHDVVGDGIEDFHPVPVGLIHASEKAGVFQRHRGVAGDGVK